MADVDLSRLPRGVLGWRTLVTWLAGTDDSAERYFLEKKSQVLLDGKHAEGKAGRAKVAKFILGAANRDPDRSARRFEGHALMVLGVGDNGNVPGVPAFEALDLENDVQRFTGVDGPRWDFERVNWDNGRDVIVIIVDPPDGRVWACRADGPENLKDGEIYIRADGGTRAAKGDEKHAMFARADMRRKPPVDVAFSFRGAFHALTCDAAVAEDYIAQQRANLIAPLSDSQLPPGLAAAIRGTRLSWGLGRPEDRSKGQYLEEIDDWEAEFRDSWPSVLAECAAALPGVSAVVSNSSTVFLEDVEVEIRFEGLRAIDSEHEPRALADLLPEPPRRWGPIPDRSFNYDALFRNGPASSPRDPSGWLLIKQADPAILHLPLRSLRPEQEYVSDPDVVLVADDPELTTVTATWRLTARGHNSVYGDTCILHRDRAIDLTAYAQDVLLPADDADR